MLCLNLPEAYGPIHCDLHFGNFYVDVPRRLITLIDFDDSACGWFSMDIATLLFDLLVLKTGSDGVRTARSFLQDFLRGYRSENEMQGTWLQQLPLFMKLMEINLYDEVVKFYPDKLERLGEKVHARTKGTHRKRPALRGAGFHRVVTHF